MGIDDLRENLRLESSGKGNAGGMIRMRAAAQEICGEQQVAVFHICDEDTSMNGFCCKPVQLFSIESILAKRDAPLRLLERVDRSWIGLSHRLHHLEAKMEDVARMGERAKKALEAYRLVTFQSEIAQRKNLDCRQHLDALDRCEGPLHFLISMERLHSVMNSTLDGLDRAVECLEEKRSSVLLKFEILARHSGRSARKLLRRKVSKVRRLTLRASRLAWSNRYVMMAALVAAKGAAPFVEELLKGGIDHSSAAGIADSFARLLSGGFQHLACPLLERPAIMAELVHFTLQRLLENAPGFVDQVKKRFPGIRVAQLRSVHVWLDEKQRAHSSQELKAAYQLSSLYLTDFWSSLAKSICPMAKQLLPLDLAGAVGAARAGATAGAGGEVQQHTDHGGVLFTGSGFVQWNLGGGRGVEDQFARSRQILIAEPIAPFADAAASTAAIFSMPWVKSLPSIISTMDVWIGLTVLLSVGFPGYVPWVDSPEDLEDEESFYNDDDSDSSCFSLDDEDGDRCWGDASTLASRCCYSFCMEGRCDELVENALGLGGPSTWTMTNVKEAARSIQRRVHELSREILVSEGCEPPEISE